MSLRLLCRAFPKARPRTPFTRSLSSGIPPRPGLFRNGFTTASVGLASGTVILAGTLTIATQYALHADADISHEKTTKQPFSTLVRSYVVYTMCSFPTLIDWSPTLLSTLLSVPIVKEITEAFVRITFFNQFVGADSADDALPLLEQLRGENKGCLFAYSVEVDEESAAGKGKDKAAQPIHKEIVQEMIHNIDVAADFEDRHALPGSAVGRRTWVAIKLTALLPNHQSIINLSKFLVQNRPTSTKIPFPGTPDPSDLNILYTSSRPTDSPLTDQDIVDLNELHADLNAICKHAQERGVKIIIDAEYSWYQPAVDAFALSLMRKYNKIPESPSSSQTPAVQPLVYNTYQSYLRRAPSHLVYSLQAAKASGYSLGVKLVRGAYHPHETAMHNAASLPGSKHEHSLSISPDALPPVWSTKQETDTCYNECARLLIETLATDIKISHAPRRSHSWSSLFGLFGSNSGRSTVPTLGILFGTHNWTSCKLVLDELLKRGLASVEDVTVEGEPVVRIGGEVTERLTMAQLYGMHDRLTNYLVERTRTSSPFVIKYIPYGSLKDVMPYLSRRAIENKSVLGEGAAAEERQRAWALIRERVGF